MKQIFKISIFLFIVLGFFSCTTVYYVGQAETPTNIYSTQDTSSNVVCTIPVGSKVLIKKKRKKYFDVAYMTYEGYSYKTLFSNYRKFNSTVDGDLYGYSTTKRKALTSPSSGRSVNVKGYYRKNGTYVKPYTRSSPSRKN